MKNFVLITNQLKDAEGLYTRKVAEYLESHGGKAICIAGEHLLLKEDSEEKTLLRGLNQDAAECALVLGGDGTLLQAARSIMNQDIPLIGINLGTLGYLAEVEIANMEEAMDKLLADAFIREERMMLEGRVDRCGGLKQSEEEGKNYALNDIVISRCGSIQLLTLHIYVNGQLLNTYSADGMIVATPTGSTGYNMSAGGPIVEPGAKLLLLTPICAHTLNSRSIVLAPEDEVRIGIPQGRDGQMQTVEASFDGSHKVPLQTGDSIVIRKAVKTIGILKLNTESFLAVLHKKMSD